MAGDRVSIEIPVSLNLRGSRGLLGENPVSDYPASIRPIELVLSHKVIGQLDQWT